MNTAEVDAYLRAKPGAEKDFKAEWGWCRYLVGGKMFAAEFMVGPEHKELYKGRHLLTLKCDPAWAEALRAELPDAVYPGFYMDKRNWISIDLDADVVDGLLMELCDHSYELVFSKLTKKLQREIAAATAKTSSDF